MLDYKVSMQDKKSLILCYIYDALKTLTHLEKFKDMCYISTIIMMKGKPVKAK